MEIEEAFTTEAIQDTDTNVGDEEEDRIREMFKRIEPSEELTNEDTAVLFFVAGRAFQVGNTPDETGMTIPVSMSPAGVSMYIEYLVTLLQRGTNE